MKTWQQTSIVTYLNSSYRTLRTPLHVAGMGFLQMQCSPPAGGTPSKLGPPVLPALWTDTHLQSTRTETPEADAMALTGKQAQTQESPGSAVQGQDMCSL